jgi:hypothetical protein
MDKINIVNDLKPYCFQIAYEFDHPRLLESLDILMERIGQSVEAIHNRFTNGEFPSNSHMINLTHLPGLTGDDRFLKHSGKTGALKDQGIFEKDFSEHLSEMEDLYIGQVIRDVYKQHNRKFQGRSVLIWMGPNGRYGWHRDIDSLTRYHIPLITNEKCYFQFKDKDEEIYQVHLPTETAWYVDPVTLEHTFINNSDTPRLHLMITTGI